MPTYASGSKNPKNKTGPRIDLDLVKRVIRENIETLCRNFFPKGKKEGSDWRIGSINGEPGRSLSICLQPDKAGLFQDRAGSGDQGDFIKAVQISCGLTFADACLAIGQAIGVDVQLHQSGSASVPNQSSTKLKPLDWARLYKLSDTDIDELSHWRGLSPKFCRWAATNSFIGRHKLGYWAFPVYNNGTIVGAHLRKDKNDWEYRPSLKSLGIELTPLVIGDLSKAEKTFTDESQWDLFAVLDKLGIQYGEPIVGICTRGAQNGALVAKIEIRGELYLIPQNDQAGQSWLEHVLAAVGCTVKVIVVPPAYHDVDEWLGALSNISEFVEAILQAAEREPKTKATKTERLQLFNSVTLAGADVLAVQIPPKELIVEDWLKAGEVGYVYAYRGTGKSWFILQLCNAVAAAKTLGPWNVVLNCPVLYVDGEMSHQDTTKRIIALGGKIPDNLYILNHEVLFHRGAAVINLATRIDQEIILQICLAKKIKVLVLDNLSCLFVGVGENDADEWDKVKPWLLELRRYGISVLVVHHTGYDQTRMRGTSSREDAASWVLRLDNKKEDFDQPGAHFISRFTKYRGYSRVLDYEWKFEPVGETINVTYDHAGRGEVFLQWVRDGLTRCEDIAKEMGISKGWASKIAAQLLKAGLLRKKGRDYELV
jgi:putative DNA primase/helicase